MPPPKLDFETIDNLSLAFDSTAFQLRVRPQKAGLFDVELSTPSGKSRLVTVLTVAATPGPPSHHFLLKPTDTVSRERVEVKNGKLEFNLPAQTAALITKERDWIWRRSSCDAEVEAIDPFDYAANELQPLAGERQKT